MSQLHLLGLFIALAVRYVLIHSACSFSVCRRLHLDLLSLLAAEMLIRYHIFHHSFRFAVPLRCSGFSHYCCGCIQNCSGTFGLHTIAEPSQSSRAGLSVVWSRRIQLCVVERGLASVEILQPTSIPDDKLHSHPGLPLCVHVNKCYCEKHRLFVFPEQQIEHHHPHPTVGPSAQPAKQVHVCTN